MGAYHHRSKITKNVMRGKSNGAHGDLLTNLAMGHSAYYTPLRTTLFLLVLHGCAIGESNKQLKLVWFLITEMKTTKHGIREK